MRFLLQISLFKLKQNKKEKTFWIPRFKLIIKNFFLFQSHPVLLFPEGYCTNNTSILRFRKAIFKSGINIYPIALRLVNIIFTINFFSIKFFILLIFLYQKFLSPLVIILKYFQISHSDLLNSVKWFFFLEMKMINFFFLFF